MRNGKQCHHSAQHCRRERTWVVGWLYPNYGNRRTLPHKTQQRAAFIHILCNAHSKAIMWLPPKTIIIMEPGILKEIPRIGHLNLLHSNGLCVCVCLNAMMRRMRRRRQQRDGRCASGMCQIFHWRQRHDKHISHINIEKHFESKPSCWSVCVCGRIVMVCGRPI